MSNGDSQGSSSIKADATATSHISLPKYIQRQGDGLYVALREFDSTSHFSNFVDRIFRSDIYFVGLDYQSLINLLYEWSMQDIFKLAIEYENAGKPPLLRLAQDIAPFSAERQKYYRPVKFVENSEAVEYSFEPIFEESLQAASGSNTLESKLQRVVLSADEFVAWLWSKNVRFGIDIDLVANAFATDYNDSLIVARASLPTDGLDSSIEELINTLHRDNAPKVLADGRVDLRQFQNRFPQVEKNTHLIKKIPRQLGKPGRTLAGQEIAPDIPEDFDIEALAGPGTRVERSMLGELIIADMLGFLQIEPRTRVFSIVEKIINHEGVSQRTTGNLVLRGDQYEEHGIVEERAQVEGMHMTFMADVFGDLISRGGNVILKEKLVAGSIKNPGGTITIEGNASRSSLEAPGGTIVMEYAESCRIVGKKVTIEKAVHCDILAQELQMGSSEGCTLAGAQITIEESNARHDVETTISVLLPDISALAKELAELTRQKSELNVIAEKRRTEIVTISERQEVKNYLILDARLRANELKMTIEQEGNWQKLLGRVTPLLKRSKILANELRDISLLITKISSRIDTIIRETSTVSHEISCRINTVSGDTIVRTMIVHPEDAALDTLPARELHNLLRTPGADSTVLFNDSSGEFELEWSEDDAAS